MQHLLFNFEVFQTKSSCLFERAFFSMYPNLKIDCVDGETEILVCLGSLEITQLMDMEENIDRLILPIFISNTGQEGF